MGFLCCGQRRVAFHFIGAPRHRAALVVAGKQGIAFGSWRQLDQQVDPLPRLRHEFVCLQSGCPSFTALGSQLQLDGKEGLRIRQLLHRVQGHTLLRARCAQGVPVVGDGLLVRAESGIGVAQLGQ